MKYAIVTQQGTVIAVETPDKPRWAFNRELGEAELTFGYDTDNGTFRASQIIGCYQILDPKLPPAEKSEPLAF